MFRTLLVTTAIALSLSACTTPYKQEENRYEQTNFVANKKKYKPTLATDKDMVNAWGISIRPAGAGGHFWVTAANKSIEYVGDVQNSPNEKLRAMHQDELKVITLPVGGADNFATGTVFSGSKTDFTITQKVKGAAPITAPAKFLFASDGGIISAWTERKKADGTFDRAGEAIAVVDESKQGAQFFGLAIDSKYTRIYAADFGAKPDIKVYDGNFKRLPMKFDMPFDENKNGKVDAGEYAPFNVQNLKTPAGEDRIFVAYAKTQACPKAEIKAGTCKKGEIFAGEEDTSKPGYGRVAEFTEEGKLVRVIADGGKLSAPWGLAFAPDNFGALSNTLLVSNFGDGTIAAYDDRSYQFRDMLRDKAGKPVAIEGIWGLLFGNGASLGDSNALYFAAGPADETDGIFGSLRVSK